MWVKTKKYNLVLMDIQMPEIDSYSAARFIRNELKLDIPIVAMTAHALAGERERCLGYGMYDYISKPIHEEQLYRLIGQFTKLNRLTISNKEYVVNTTYKYIRIKYMQEVSMGNMEYEKTDTEQFIEAIPDELLAMEKALQLDDRNALKTLAHEDIYFSDGID